MLSSHWKLHDWHLCGMYAFMYNGYVLVLDVQHLLTYMSCAAAAHPFHLAACVSQPIATVHLSVSFQEREGIHAQALLWQFATVHAGKQNGIVLLAGMLNIMNVSFGTDGRILGEVAKSNSA